jgi:hypothetical protein
MKRFTLLFTPGIDQAIAADTAKFKEGHDCTKCAIAKICPINTGSIKVSGYIAIQADKFPELKKLINELHADKDTDFILLIDDKKDVAYIYKAKGTLNQLKKTTLPTALKVYEAGIKEESVFFTLEDLRLTMPFKDDPGN